MISWIKNLFKQRLNEHVYDVLIVHYDGQPMKSIQVRSASPPTEVDLMSNQSVYRLKGKKYTNVQRVFVTKREEL